MANKTTMRSGNRGLTAKVYLFPTEQYEGISNEGSALWFKGKVVNADAPGREVAFNSPGDLLNILGRWNKKKCLKLRARRA